MTVFYDTETGFYYANGSYYDPTTGTYLDASPISSIFSNITELNNLDRNAPVCNNILELAGNPYTVFTATNLSPDPTYDPNANAPWYVIVRNWIHNIIYQIYKWFNGISREDKFKVGVVLLALSLIISVGTGNPALIFVELAIGIGIGIASYLISPLFTGQSLTWDGLADAVVDSFLITSAFIFISTSFNAIKVLARSKPVTTAELAQETSASYKMANRGSTGRVEPRSLNEKLAMEQTMSNPLNGKELTDIPMRDARWTRGEGWVKMQQHYVFYDNSYATIHYVKNDILMLVDDFKFI